MVLLPPSAALGLVLALLTATDVAVHASRPRTLLQDKKATIQGAWRAGRPADERGRELQARIHAARRALSPAGTGLLLAADYPGSRADK